MTGNPQRRRSPVGRPRVTGDIECSRCHRLVRAIRARWQGERICGVCVRSALRTRGICPGCGHEGVLPGRRKDQTAQPICITCAGIRYHYTCAECGLEGENYRAGQCARCALRAELVGILLDHPADRDAMTKLIDILCCADRPESILSWLRRPSVVDLLSGISTGAIDLTHDGLSATESSPRVDHLRRILQHHGLLPERDEHLAQFETWLAAKLDAIPSPIVRAPVQQFATWHHLRRLRDASQPGQSSAASKRSAKQEITETIKFLTWLEQAHNRHAGDCTQQDVDEYLHSGPSTRYLIRTFIVWARQSSINKSVTVRRRITQNTPTITNGQRLEWIKELLTGESESLPYRVAGILLLLYAQPLTKIAALRTTDVIDVDGETRLRLG